MSRARIAVVPRSRPGPDLALADARGRAALALLERLEVSITGPRGPLLDTAGLMRAARTLAEARPDLLLILQLTYTSPMQTVRIAKAVAAPVLLWGFPEPGGSRSGGTDSLRGVGLAMRALASEGIICRCLRAQGDDPAAEALLADCLRSTQGAPIA